MSRIASFLYGLAAYAFFLVTFLYAIGFVTGLIVPKTLDSGTAVPLFEAIAINLALLTIFAVQHSGMARKPFKQWLTRHIPEPIERPTYVLLATSALALLMWQWRPMPDFVWHVTDPSGAMALQGIALLGWLIVLLSTFMISHFELFGLHQVLANLMGKAMPLLPPHAYLHFSYGRALSLTGVTTWMARPSACRVISSESERPISRLNHEARERPSTIWVMFSRRA